MGENNLAYPLPVAPQNMHEEEALQALEPVFTPLLPDAEDEFESRQLLHDHNREDDEGGAGRERSDGDPHPTERTETDGLGDRDDRR